MKIIPRNVFYEKMTFCPVYWEKVTVPNRYKAAEEYNNWLFANISGRFHVGKCLTLDKDNRLTEMVEIGFEQKKDSTYFLLACPLFQKQT